MYDDDCVCVGGGGDLCLLRYVPPLPLEIGIYKGILGLGFSWKG